MSRVPRKISRRTVLKCSAGPLLKPLAPSNQSNRQGRLQDYRLRRPKAFFTARASRVIQLCKSQSNSYMQSAQILLNLSIDEGFGSSVLSRFGLTHERIRMYLAQAVSGGFRLSHSGGGAVADRRR